MNPQKKLDFSSFYFIGRIELGLKDEEFWYELTPALFFDLVKRYRASRKYEAVYIGYSTALSMNGKDPVDYLIPEKRQEPQKATGRQIRAIFGI